MSWITVGALLGAVGVALGAFGAHALEGRLDARELGWWSTAVLYHLLHALALVLLGLFERQRGPRGLAAGWGFLLGVLLFSGTLYAMALGAPRWLGAITPAGGTLLIAGWLALAWQARR